MLKIMSLDLISNNSKCVETICRGELLLVLAKGGGGSPRGLRISPAQYPRKKMITSFLTLTRFKFLNEKLYYCPYRSQKVPISPNFLAKYILIPGWNFQLISRLHNSQKVKKYLSPASRLHSGGDPYFKNHAGLLFHEKIFSWSLFMICFKLLKLEMR